MTIEERFLQGLAPIDSLLPDEVPRILAKLEELRATLWRKLLAPSRAIVATTPSPAPALMTVTEVASALRFSRGHIYELIRCGDLPAVKKGRAVRVTVQTLSEWQALHQSGALDSQYSVSLESSGDRRSSETHPRHARLDAGGVRSADRRPRRDRGEVGDGRAGNSRTRRPLDRPPGKGRREGRAPQDPATQTPRRENATGG